jgi:hypothetical protein
MAARTAAPTATAEVGYRERAAVCRREALSRVKSQAACLQRPKSDPLSAVVLIQKIGFRLILLFSAASGGGAVFFLLVV